MFTEPQPVELKALSAAELLTLLDPSAKPKEVFKAGLKELLARGLLRIEKKTSRGPLGLTKSRNLFRLQPDQALTNPVLQQLVAHLLSAMRYSEDAYSVLYRMRSVFGLEFAGFKRRIVLPHLERLGLIRAERRPLLGLFSRTHYELTASGQVLCATLRRSMAQARQEARLGDLSRLAARVGGLGAAVLLLPEIWPQLMAVDPLLRQSDEGWVFFNSTYLADGFGNLECALATLDASVDASDGGGGDGGGE